MSLTPIHSPNYCASKIQSTYRGYRERKFSKLLNQWVQSGPDNERVDRTSASELIKSCQEISFNNYTNSFSKPHHLHIHSKNISTLPNIFDHLTHLVEVHITNTNIQQLPDSFFKLANLECLGFADNKLTHLPKKIEQLKKLSWLCLEDNMLTALPKKELTNLSNLRELRCRKNIILDINRHLLEKYKGISFHENLAETFYSNQKYNFNLIPTLSMEKLAEANNFIKSNKKSNIIDYFKRKAIGLPNDNITIMHTLIQRELKNRKLNTQ